MSPVRRRMGSQLVQKGLYPDKEVDLSTWNMPEHTGNYDERFSPNTTEVHMSCGRGTARGGERTEELPEQAITWEFTNGNRGVHSAGTQYNTETGGTEEEMLCWSGPLKRKPSPVRCDQRVFVTEPVMRASKRMSEGANRQKSTTDGAAANRNKAGGSVDDGLGSKDTNDILYGVENTRQVHNTVKFGKYIDAKPLRTVPPFEEQEQEEIECWSGPPKRPRSPIRCTEQVIVTEPVYRVSKRPRHTEGSKDTRPTNTTGRDNVQQHTNKMSTKRPNTQTEDRRKSKESTDGEGEVHSERHPTGNDAPENPNYSQAQSSKRSRTDNQDGDTERRNAASTHIPPRDPLCHVPIVTPPGPISSPQQTTADGQQSYTHAPELPRNLIPAIGQEFATYASAYDFYNAYAKHTGFGIKKGQRNRAMRYLQCVREGKHHIKLNENDRQRDRLSKRIGCKAFIRFKERDDGTCVIKDINLDHNHQLLLSPSMSVFLHSHKRVDSTLKDYIEDLHNSNVKHVSIMALLSRLHGGQGGMPLNNKDVLNMRAAFTRKAAKGAVQKMFEYFDEMKEENENFYIDFQQDEDKKIRNIFWATASSGAAYQDFGDCITFDTTYKTNKHHMPLAVFVGVNNHLQSTIFGVALMGDESIESFKWVFSTFLKCNGGKQPMTILTDQCPSMEKAIPAILTRSLHKYCRWHIMRKHKFPLKTLYKIFPALKDELGAVLNHPLMPNEFENAWDALMDKYNLRELPVMELLWKERRDWVSAYWKETFCARMTSTQRSESMNFVLKRGFVSERQDLYIFAKQVNNCIQTRREAENAETLATTGVRRPATWYGFETQLMNEYTRAVYDVFKERLYHSTAFRIKQSQDDPRNYLVHHYNQSKEFAWSRHEFRVLADEAGERFECECKLWEHTGLFCIHIIAILEHLRIDVVPKKYILKRYSRNPVTNPDFNRRDFKAKSADGTSLEYRRTILYNEAMKTVTRGCASEEMFDMALSAFKEVNARMDAVDPKVNKKDSDKSHEASQTGSAETTDNDPSRNGEGGEIPEKASKGKYDDILPPDKAKTKGSGVHDNAPKNEHKKKSGYKPKKVKKTAPGRPLPELDEHGMPKGQRLCSDCHTISGHNKRTCKRRKLEAQLLAAHQNINGPLACTKNVRLRIKNVLAQRNIKGKEDEEILLTDDEEEDSEDNIDEDGSEEEDDEEQEDEDEEQGDEEEDAEEVHTCVDDVADEAKQHKNTSEKKGRTCGNCGANGGHNKRTCERRQLAERERQERLKRDEEERQQKLQLENDKKQKKAKQNTSKNAQTGKVQNNVRQANNTEDTEGVAGTVRRSGRLMKPKE